MRPFVIAVLTVTALTLAADALRAGTTRPVSTYSIVARDPATGQLGVAVQSHWFSVGSLVPWAEAGVGAVATQSFVRVAYGPEGLDRMRNGMSASAALSELVLSDPGREVRQVAMVDASGHVATHTGERCIAHAGYLTGPGFSVQANLMADSTVPLAMANAFQRTIGDFADRLIAALRAAEDEGGDIRGRQSAAILIVDGKRYADTWQGKLVDLRVEDHPNPLDELARLYERQRAYDWMNHGDQMAEAMQWDSAAAAYNRAEVLAPDILEIPFWRAVTLASAGRVEDALPIFARVFKAEDRWAELIPRLVPAGLLPDDRYVIERILAEQPD